jgi:hypothetical protein
MLCVALCRDVLVSALCVVTCVVLPCREGRGMSSEGCDGPEASTENRCTCGDDVRFVLLLLSSAEIRHPC